MTSTWFVVVLVVALATASRPKFVTEEPAYDEANEPTSDSEHPDDQAEDYDDDPDYDLEDDEYLQADYWSEDSQPRPQHKPKRIDHFNKNQLVHKYFHLAKEHIDRVVASSSCHTPQPKVIKVLEHHPSSSKTYTPPCTILHHCSESTGCCPTHQQCGPKRSEKLELPFFVVQQVPGFDQRRSRTRTTIETLVFYNHTECGCHERDDEMPRDVTPTSDSPMTSLKPHEECKCPAPFSPRSKPGSCTCDCFDKQDDCIKYKRGRDYLKHQDRLCIETKTCKPPACDYGVYMNRFARCPRKDEQFRLK